MANVIILFLFFFGLKWQMLLYMHIKHTLNPFVFLRKMQRFLRRHEIYIVFYQSLFLFFIHMIQNLKLTNLLKGTASSIYFKIYTLSYQPDFNLQYVSVYFNRAILYISRNILSKKI